MSRICTGKELTTIARISSPTSSFHQCRPVIPLMSSRYIWLITSYTVTPFGCDARMSTYPTANGQHRTPENTNRRLWKLTRQHWMVQPHHRRWRATRQLCKVNIIMRSIDVQENIRRGEWGGLIGVGVSVVDTIESKEGIPWMKAGKESGEDVPSNHARPVGYQAYTPTADAASVSPDPKSLQ